LSAHLTRHQNTHGDTDLSVTLQRPFEVEDFLLKHDVEQRERGVGGKIALARDEGDWPNQACRLSGSSGPEGSVVDAGRTLEGIDAPLLTGFIAHVMSLQQVDARPARS
jgi:hypothetical protein